MFSTANGTYRYPNSQKCSRQFVSTFILIHYHPIGGTDSFLLNDAYSTIAHPSRQWGYLLKIAHAPSFARYRAMAPESALPWAAHEDVPEVCGIAERRFTGRWQGESSHATENHIPCMAKVPRIAHGTVTFYAILTCLWDGSARAERSFLQENAEISS